MFANAIKTKS